MMILSWLVVFSLLLVILISVVYWNRKSFRMRKVNFLHMLNTSKELRQSAKIRVKDDIIKLTFPPDKHYTNFVLDDVADFEIVEADKHVTFHVSNERQYHPDQDAFDRRYKIVKKAYPNGDAIHYSLISNTDTPSKILVTFPGISNFDNVNYRMSALTSVQKMFTKNISILAFQDKEEVFGNYMYKTVNGTAYKDLISEFIAEQLKKYQLKTSDLIFYGNSKGGTICFDYVDIFTDAKFFIDIPQVDLYHYLSQNDLIRSSLGVECRQYHNYLKFMIRNDKPYPNIVYSFAENDYDASRGIPIKEIQHVEVNMLKDMPHEGAAMRFALRQMSKIAQESGITKQVVRPKLNERLKINEKLGLMFFTRRLGKFTDEDTSKKVYAEIRFKFADRPDINISLNQYFNGEAMMVEWSRGFDYMKHLPHLNFESFLVVYYNYREIVYPLNTPVTVKG